jgi:ABC-2 type transport system permease protein
LFLIPLWLVSGALFPMNGASRWIQFVMRLNPLTYGVDALRSLLYPGAESSFPLSSAMATLLLFSLVMFGIALLMANHRTKSSPV